MQSGKIKAQNGYERSIIAEAKVICWLYVKYEKKEDARCMPKHLEAEQIHVTRHQWRQVDTRI